MDGYMFLKEVCVWCVKTLKYILFCMHSIFLSWTTLTCSFLIKNKSIKLRSKNNNDLNNVLSVLLKSCISQNEILLFDFRLKVLTLFRLKISD